MDPAQTLNLVLVVAGSIIGLLISACTALIVRSQKHMSGQIVATHTRLDQVSKRIHRLNNWCCFLAGKNDWEPPTTIEQEA